MRIHQNNSKVFVDVWGAKQAKKLLKRIVFYYTPTHASGLNMAEIEIGILANPLSVAYDEDISGWQEQIQAWAQQTQAQRKMSLAP